MFEETMSVVSIWASMNSWLTPAVLFVVLNIMIGTIAVTSGLASAPRNQNPAPNNDSTRQQQHLIRSPSVLQRLKSIKLYRSEQQPASDLVPCHPAYPNVPDPEPLHLTQEKEVARKENAVEEREVEDEETVKLQEEVKDEEEEEERPTMEQVFSQIQQGANIYTRSKSDGSHLAAPKKVRKRIIKKAASDISFAVSEFDTVNPLAPENDDEEEKENEPTVAAEQIRRWDGPDEEVDGKAEDFINRFHRQLKLQRQESLYGPSS